MTLKMSHRILIRRKCILFLIIHFVLAARFPYCMFTCLYNMDSFSAVAAVTTLYDI